MNEWQTVSQSNVFAASDAGKHKDSSEGFCDFEINQDLYLQLDHLSRDDNTLLACMYYMNHYSSLKNSLYILCIKTR